MTTKTKLFTYDHYLNLPPDSFKYEVIGGELIERPSPPTIHQIISGNLLVSLTHFIKQNDIGEVLPRLDVVLSMTDIVQPDLMFIANERSRIITDKNIVEAPDLVAEITSESTKIRDQTTKKSLYEKYGVKEYWIIYPGDEKVEQFVLQDEIFELKSSLQESEKLTSKVIEGFSLQLEEIFAN